MIAKEKKQAIIAEYGRYEDTDGKSFKRKDD